MKFLCALILLTTASYAFGHSQKVDMLEQLRFDGTNLSYAYYVGGGCEEHSTQFDLELKQMEDGQYTAKLLIVDHSDAVDRCESFVRMEGEIDLKHLLKDKLDLEGVGMNEGWNVRLKLPTLEIRPFEPNF